MMDPSDTGHDLEMMEEDGLHDQLPSVEEYKTNVGYNRSNSGFRISESSDPIGVSANNLTMSTDEGDDDHDQLPKSSDALMIGDSSSGSGKFWKVCGITSFVLLLFSIVLGVTVSNKNDSNQSWVRDSERYRIIQQYLIDAGVSKTNDLFNQTSPQHLAAQWMAHEDKLKLSIPNLYQTTAHLTFIERYALVVLYFASNGPESWTYQMNWLGDEHVCTWNEYFVLDGEDADVDDQYLTMGVHGCKRVNDELVPISIFLPNNGLRGSIPPEMSFLDRIEILNLQFNPDLTGTIPEALSKMDNLRHLALQWCGLTGSIPSWIGSFPSLKYLGLGSNHLTGTVPAEVGQLSSLELFGLDDNMLSANIDVFHQLQNIKSLYLEDNQITGTISEALMASWPKLEELDLSGNKLTGTLPNNFFNHANVLTVVDLHDNQLKGELPDQINYNSRLEFLALHDNQFTGKVPENLKNFQALRHLDVSGNGFISTLPESLGQIKTLEYLFVGNNAYQSGVVPSFLIELTNLRDLSLKTARLTGEIPEFIGYLTNLKFLDFHHNLLTGTIPARISDLSNLKHLLLKSNELTGTLPSGMDKLSNLDVLLLEQNSFVGDADLICKSNDFSLQHFVADCGDGIGCTCCNVCCDALDAICNAGDWDGNVDPIWEYGYRRGRYSYDLGPHTVIVP